MPTLIPTTIPTESPFIMCNYVNFQCESFYDGLYELDAVISSETQIFYHQDINDAVLYYDDGEWSLNHPNKYRWYTTVEEIFGSEASIYWYETDEILPQLMIHKTCTSNMIFLRNVYKTNYKLKHVWMEFLHNVFLKYQYLQLITFF